MEDVFLKIGELSEHDDSKHALKAAEARKGYFLMFSCWIYVQ